MRKMTVGDRVPNFLLPDFSGKPHELYATDIVGGPIVVAIAGTQADATAIVKQFADQAQRVAALGAHCYLLLSHAPDQLRDSAFMALHDEDGKIAEIYRTTSGLDAPALFALDPNQRIVALCSDVDRFADVAIAAFDAIAPTQPPRMISMQAPVLFIPGVIDGDLCDRLLAAWASGKREKNIVNVAKGRASSQAGQADTKRRSDYIVEGSLEHEVLLAIMPRVAPEVTRAFAFDKEWGFEKFRVGCYEAADAGFFRAHRDNPSAGLQHRQFALSINLNEGYEGGYLQFPEYGVDHYAPPKGGALVFACGLLHAVAPLTAGRRFSLLTFLDTQ
jgi:predicted 2-oxoglutarate/Fe(II)-dependent dioxygenase YbiX